MFSNELKEMVKEIGAYSETLSKACVEFGELISKDSLSKDDEWKVNMFYDYIWGFSHGLEMYRNTINKEIQKGLKENSEK